MATFYRAASLLVGLMLIGITVGGASAQSRTERPTGACFDITPAQARPSLTGVILLNRCNGETWLLVSLMLLLGLVGISAQALGETARTQAAATPGSVTFGELEGFIIEANIVRDQLTQRDGRQVPQQAHTSWRIVIGPEVSIQSTVNVTFYNPHGQRKAEPLTGSFILDQSRHVGSRGGGQGVWHFEEGTLTFTRTFEQGAFRIKFAFSRKDEGLSCQASESFARENGTGPIAMQSAINGQPITMIRAKQISSNCRVFKGM